MGQEGSVPLAPGPPWHPSCFLASASAENVQTQCNPCWAEQGPGDGWLRPARPRGRVGSIPSQHPRSGLQPRCAPGLLPLPAGGCRGCPCCGLILQTLAGDPKAAPAQL